MTDFPDIRVDGPARRRARGGSIARFGAVLIVAGAISACGPDIVNHGSLPDKDQVAAIKSGQTTRNEVLRRLGSPSAQSAFDNKTWFYIASKKASYAFLTPTLRDRQVLEIKFNDAGVVSSMKRYGMKDAKNVEVVTRTTPTRGREPGLVRSLMDLLIRGPVNRNNPAVSTPNTSRTGIPGL